MGYIFAGILLVVAVVLIASAWRSRGGRGQGHLPSDHPVSRTEPAADEPTPAASDTADAGDARRAQKRVPPA